MVMLIRFTLLYTAALTLAALGGMFSSRGGIFAIGLEGMMVLGGLAGALAAQCMALPPALTALGPILIAGGYDKQIPYDALGPEICEHVKLLVLTGATAPKIREAVLSCGSAQRSCPEILEIDDFTEAVKTAAARAKAGDAVILSPASAAFDKFKNFMVRGREFKKTVMEL